MRLIDADKLKQDVLDWEDCPNGYSDTYDKAMIIDEIDEQPTIDAESIRHGKWIHTGFMEIKCSDCGNVFHELEDINYCPSCGAKMIPTIPKEIIDAVLGEDEVEDETN